MTFACWVPPPRAQPPPELDGRGGAFGPRSPYKRWQNTTNVILLRAIPTAARYRSTRLRFVLSSKQVNRIACDLFAALT